MTLPLFPMPPARTMTRSTAARLITAVVMKHIHEYYAYGANLYGQQREHGSTAIDIEWAKRDHERRKELLKALEVLTGEKQGELFG